MKAHPGAEVAMRAAETALATLRGDLRVSGPQPRQRFLIRHVADALDTLKWHIDVENASPSSADRRARRAAERLPGIDPLGLLA